jgi:hypothetical protein
MLNRYCHVGTKGRDALVPGRLPGAKGRFSPGQLVLMYTPPSTPPPFFFFVFSSRCTRTTTLTRFSPQDSIINFTFTRTSELHIYKHIHIQIHRSDSQVHKRNITGSERGFGSGLWSGFNFGAGTKGLSSTWPEIAVVAGPPLVPVGITNRDKRGAPNGSVRQ